MKHLLAIGCALSLMQPAEAQATDLSDWYQIEIVLFKHSSPTISNELWPREVPAYPADIVAIAPQGEPIKPPSPVQLMQPGMDSQLFKNIPPSEEAKSVEFSDRGTNSQQGGEEVLGEPVVGLETPTTLSDEETPVAYQELPPAFQNLTGIARIIRRSPRYEIVLHRVWAQPIQTLPTNVLLQAGRRYDNLFEIEGTVSLHRSRFLHFQTNLWFNQFESQDPATAVSGLERAALSSVSYPLRQTRRMRSGTLHYIDHPYVGMLIRIDQYNPAIADDLEVETP